jgi:hypothetical protein
MGNLKEGDDLISGAPKGPDVTETTEGRHDDVGSQDEACEFPNDPIVANVEDALTKLGMQALPQDLIVFAGLTGPAHCHRDKNGNDDSDHYQRLYLTAQLNEYVEYRCEDVLYSSPINVTPIFGQMVWLRPGAEVTHVRMERLELERSFMQGSLFNPFYSPAIPFGWGSNAGGGSFSCGGGSFSCGGGSFSCGGGSFSCGGGSFSCGGGSFSCGGGSFSCGGGSFSCGGGGSFSCR